MAVQIAVSFEYINYFAMQNVLCANFKKIKHCDAISKQFCIIQAVSFDNIIERMFDFLENSRILWEKLKNL